MFKYEISGYKYCTCGVKFTFESVEIYFRFIELCEKVVLFNSGYLPKTGETNCSFCSKSLN